MAAALNRRSLIGAAGKPSNAIGSQESCDPPLQPSLGCPRMEEGSAWSGDGCHCRHLGNCECEKDLKFVLWERLSLKFGEYDADACCNGAASSPGFFLFLLPSCPWFLPPHSNSYGQICVYLGLCELRMGHRQLQFKLHSSSTYNVPSSQFQPPLASPTTTASSCRTTFHFSTSQSPYQPGSQLALPRLTGNLPLHVTMWIRHLDSSPAYDHVDSSCDLALPGISSFGSVMWTRQKAARPEINPYQPLLNQLRFPPTIQWVSSRKGPIRTSVQPSPSTPSVRLSLPPMFVIPLDLLCSWSPPTSYVRYPLDRCQLPGFIIHHHSEPHTTSNQRR